MQRDAEMALKQEYIIFMTSAEHHSAPSLTINAVNLIKILEPNI